MSSSQLSWVPSSTSEDTQYAFIYAEDPDLFDAERELDWAQWALNEAEERFHFANERLSSSINHETLQQLEINEAKTRRRLGSLVRALHVLSETDPNGEHQQSVTEEVVRAEIQEKRRVLSALEDQRTLTRARVARVAAARGALEQAEKRRIQAENNHKRQLKRHKAVYARG